MDLFTVRGNGVLTRCGTEDDIMAGSAVHGVGSSVPIQDDVVASMPAVDRVLPEAVEDEVRPRLAEDQIGAGAPIDPELRSDAAVDGVGTWTAPESVLSGAAADGVVTATRVDLVGPRPAVDGVVTATREDPPKMRSGPANA
jgi:hypothetical protein